MQAGLWIEEKMVWKMRIEGVAFCGDRNLCKSQHRDQEQNHSLLWSWTKEFPAKVQVPRVWEIFGGGVGKGQQYDLRLFPNCDTFK